MKKFPVVLDLETKYTFREFDDPKKLGISVVAIYNYGDRTSQVFMEEELNKLFPVLEKSSYIVGYNVVSFDMAVLQAYYPGKITNFSAFDILEDIRVKIGRRIGLNDVAFATLGKKKSGHGLMAIDYYKEGKFEELKKYCMDDTMITKELFDYGVTNGEIFYLTPSGKTSIKVDWKKYLESSDGGNDMSLTLPF